MSAWNYQPSRSLADWLTTATEKLSLPAKERIKLEITSHFKDASEACLAQGLSEADAEAKALADLGDARSAARRFQREHLTVVDVKTIRKNLLLIKGQARRLTIVLCAGVLGADIAGDGLQRFGRHNPGYLLIAIVTLFYLSVGSTRHFLPTVKNRLRPNVPSLLRTSSILDLTYMGAVWIVFGVTWLGILTVCPLLLAKLAGFPSEIRLWLKVRRMTDVWREMPPPGAVGS